METSPPSSPSAVLVWLEKELAPVGVGELEREEETPECDVIVERRIDWRQCADWRVATSTNGFPVEEASWETLCKSSSD